MTFYDLFLTCFHLKCRQFYCKWHFGEVMTSLVGPFIIGEADYSISNDVNHNIRHCGYRNALKSKENTCKYKCKKVHKKKLKKYKRRQDGEEDQDIIDVSNTLLTSLLIRSPNKSKNCVDFKLEEVKPKNYLFKMVRKKQSSKTTKNTHSSNTEIKTPEENKILNISPATEEKRKHTNAFTLLMDSRNKILGTNSPGKEKPIEEIESQEFIEKKTIKVKRSLILQKMAEDKGSLKNKEITEQHEKYLQKKMEKRAERLKSMIMNKEPKMVNDGKQKINLQKVRSPLDSIDTGKNRKVLDKSISMLKLVSIFSEDIDHNISPERKDILKEDEEFLNKLSPSIRKKESMLSYFKKVDKDAVSPVVDSENDNDVIKVKLGTISKKKGRKKKISLIKDTERLRDVSDDKIKHIDVEVVETTKQQGNEMQQIVNLEKKSLANSSKERRKRKRKIKESSPCSNSTLINCSSDPTDDIRPSRTVKRPFKYNAVVVTSSDEELIFSPKKKKHIDYKNLISKTMVKQNTVSCDPEILKPVKKSAEKCEKITKAKKLKDVIPPKPVKLAPIFTKYQPDPAAIEAKQKFLQSGVPEQLKKLKSKQKDCNSLSITFPTVVHVQQLDIALPEPPKLNMNEELTGMDAISLTNCEDTLTKILNLSTSQTEITVSAKDNVNINTILQKLKTVYPRFPVNRTYKLLRGKKKGEFRDSNMYSNLDNSVEILNCSIDMQNDNPDQLTWSDKYKPLSGNEIIGNSESIKELKKWLVTWTENDRKSKHNNLNDSDSSDYYQSDPDSRDSIKSNNNLLILSGPVGSGKTSCVYAVAAELSIKVIEVNASSKRTGKIMLQDLQEATQSHKVNRKAGSAENSQKSQETAEPTPEIKVKKRGRPKKVIQPPTLKNIILKEKLEVMNGPSASQDRTRTAMSLILIDDADIVFEQDDGFCSAIMQLVQCSKRPVILITGSLSLPHLQRFLQCSKILKMQPLLPNLLGTWLDLMCLADSGTCLPGLGAKFLNFFKGDMRKTINCLQFYVVSQDQALNIEGNSQTNSQYSDAVKLNSDNENSCMSWTDREVVDDKNANEVCNTVSQTLWDIFVREYTHLKCMKCQLKTFDVWWSVPKMFNMESCLNSEIPINNVELKNGTRKSLESMSNVLDSISVCDYFGCVRPETKANMTSHPWYDSECDSVSELENLDYYDQKYETSNGISYELITGSISYAQESIGMENRFDLDFPGMSAKRQRDRIVSRLNNLTSYLSPQSSLDRKALALDYWSSCRSICRIEKSKTDFSSKRNNRFCHYLKSLSVLCTSETFDSLANSLRSNENS